MAQPTPTISVCCIQMALPESLPPEIAKVVAIAMIMGACLPSPCAAFTDAGAAVFELDLYNCIDPQAFAESNTFYTNDILVFEYPPIYNVLEVNQTAFVDCQTANPIREYDNNGAVVKLSEPGEQYYIFDGPVNCLLKLSINVTSGTRLASDKTIKRCPQQKLLSSTVVKLNETPAPAPAPGPPASVAHRSTGGVCDGMVLLPLMMAWWLVLV